MNVKDNMRIIYIVLILALPSLIIAQPPTSAEEYEKQYQTRITKKYLDGVYIPKNLDNAIEELNRLSDASGLEKFKSMQEDVVVKKAHFGLGRWISNNWGFEFGSRYSHYLRTAGISHPDDMIRVTLLMWHRSLNDQELGFQQEAERIKARDLQLQELRNQKKDTVVTMIKTTQPVQKKD